MGRRAAFRAAARAQRVCALTGQGGAFHAHHAVSERHVRLAGGDPFDPRNALRLKVGVHFNHHGIYKLPIGVLTDENIAFAYELLGPAAYDYLTRYYTGRDPRVTIPGHAYEPLPLDENAAGDGVIR